MIPGYEHIVAEHRPAGYKLLRRRMRKHNGIATFQRTITINRELEGREALFVFLHEAGHIHGRHVSAKAFPTAKVMPAWQYEFEADKYAIGVFKAHGIPIPRALLADHKHFVRAMIEEDDGAEHVPEEILRYAYGRGWRKNR